MKIFLMILLAVASLILIVSVLMQSGNSAGLSGSIAGGAEQLFGSYVSQDYDGCGSSLCRFSHSTGYDGID